LLALEISFPCERGGKTLGGKEEKAFTTDDWEKCQCNPLGKKRINSASIAGERRDAFNKPFTDESIHLFTSIAMELA
jgi:hypothetical protein